MSAGPTTADPFDRRPDAELGHAGPLVALEPGLRRVTCPNPSPMTFTGTRTYIVGRGEVAVVDPGPEHPGHLEATLAALEPGERVSHIVLTHTHIDHSPGVPALKARTGAQTWAFGPHGAGMSERMQALAASGAKLGGGEGGDRSFQPDRTLADGERLEGAGWALTAIHTPGHISNHLAFEVEAEGMAPGLVLSGDHVMGWATSIVSPPDGDMAAYMASLRKLQGRGHRVFHAGHGHPIEDPEAMIAHLIAHRESRVRQVLAALPSPGMPGKDPLELARGIYTDVDPALIGAAARNVFSVLLGLVEDGRAEHEGVLSDQAKFRHR
ncbi:MBL fold metallo-hydrolase [Albimonas sp. CAU 1670]|uniref:MBL fold metallo-hydrolase n=1 Tax=Albimonas sp. CAU 1670 TaxID=3032599 RepID=UPI0023DB1686|nr:MBL fold metallo-hydrolase [Albimonas sp. CAU 1670]MDF2231082.1 MBL fold metallo-hydrolase [Albimonas sp. CAU 1670]